MKPIFLSSIVVMLGIVTAIATGCTTLQSTAYTMPDGTKHLDQKLMVTAGGKLTDGLLDLSANATGADGSLWAVKSGTGAGGAESPDSLSQLLPAIVQMYSTGVAAGQEQALAEISAGLRTPGAAKTDLLNRLLDRVTIGGAK